MVRIVLIFALVLQPLWLSAAQLRSIDLPKHTAEITQTCCSTPRATPPMCSQLGPCCTGATICACDHNDNQQPQSVPTRGPGSGADQLLALLRLPATWIVQIERPDPPTNTFPEADCLLLPAVACYQAFNCVWLT